MAKGLAGKSLSFLTFLALLFSPILMIGCISTTQMQINSGSISDIVNGNNQFALEMFSKLGDQQENVFFSPWSVYLALAMASEGAKGKTAKEMQQVMHFPENDSLRMQSFASAYDMFNAKDAGYILSTANALWVEKEYPLLSNFSADIEKYYHGTARNVDFKGATEDTRKTINSWVEERTNNKIKDLISPGGINLQTQLVITNAVYFNGLWVRSFDKNATKKGDFKTGDGRIIETPMMESLGKESLFNYTETGDMQMLELPYKGKKISMIILLPKSDDISLLEKSLSIERLAEWKKGLREGQVDVYIPKFTFTAKYFMARNFEDMGMSTAFTPEANFSGISGRKDLFINEIIHQTFVDVNEEGTEAAAATAIAMPTMARDAPRIPVFNADHPFVFIIQDTETGNILFMGRVSDPSKN
jgi:serpin B